MQWRGRIFLASGFLAAVGCSSDGLDGGAASLDPEGTTPAATLTDGGARTPGADSRGDGGPAIDATSSAPTYKHYDINHVLSTRASDSVANGASEWITATQPFGNLSFDVGVMTAGNCNGVGCTQYETPTSFVPLHEGDRFFGYGVETMSSGLANQATVFASDYFARVGLPKVQHDVLVSLHGRSGNSYWCLRLQTANVNEGYHPCYYPESDGLIAPFDEALMQVRSAKSIAEAEGKSYVVRAVTAIHGQGESDSNEQNFGFLLSTDGENRRLLNYTDALLDWQWDYETKVREITGQTEALPMFISQFGTMTTDTSIIPQRQLDAHTSSNGKVILVAPNYPFPPYQDCNHYLPHSQRWLGAQFAKAYERVVIEGGKWEPTRPLGITRAGNVLTVRYVVPVPPLVVDTERVSARTDGFATKPFYGFIYRDSTMSASITNVVVTAPDTVTVTLSAAPTGADKVLRYAFESQTADRRCPGPEKGARGNIRDSDPTLAYHTDAAGKPYELFNWSVAFEMAVP